MINYIIMTRRLLVTVGISILYNRVVSVSGLLRWCINVHDAVLCCVHIGLDLFHGHARFRFIFLSRFIFTAFASNSPGMA